MWFKAYLGLLCCAFYIYHQNCVIELQREIIVLKEQAKAVHPDAWQLCQRDEQIDDHPGLTDEACVASFFCIICVIGLRFYSELKQIHARTVSTGCTYSAAALYRVDLWFSGEKWSKPIALSMLVVLVISMGGVFFWLVDSEVSLADALWRAWLCIADTSSHAEQKGFLHVSMALIMTIIGMIVSGFLIGIVAELINERMDSLKKGKSRVVESNHILFLGYNDKSIAVIVELVLANESEGGAIIVILSPQPKEEVEQLVLDARLDLRGSTIVVC